MFRLSALTKANLYLRRFAKTKVPLIHYCRPKIVALDEKSIELKIPLNKRTKNHLNSMYFGTLSVGADITSGFLAMIYVYQSKQPIQLVFKDFKADFLKRAEADVHFHCQNGAALAKLVQQAITSGERHHMKVQVVARCPSINDDPVAQFELTLSLKNKP